jgi:hypothetical protein
MPWLYQYGVGGVFFIVSIWLTLRSGALNRERYSHRFTLAALCAALSAFLLIHAAWIAWVLA